ncbi:hypothetical protein [Demequina sp.]|uniref:hypothetical protein n=1 Tax=Demequina sp. TaxID=2050685 RepID=UPI0025C5FD94|nr:hypothetical protein [Demequina sp.]
MSDGTEPTPDHLRDSAIPATYRRAPRTERFILTGVGIGLFVGLILGATLPAGTAVGRGVAMLLLGLGGALAGGLVTGAQAAVIEYVSGRSADRQRDVIEAEAAAGFEADDNEGTADGPR